MLRCHLSCLVKYCLKHKFKQRQSQKQRLKCKDLSIIFNIKKLPIKKSTWTSCTFISISKYTCFVKLCLTLDRRRGNSLYCWEAPIQSTWGMSRLQTHVYHEITLKHLHVSFPYMDALFCHFWRCALHSAHIHPLDASQDGTQNQQNHQ